MHRYLLDLEDPNVVVDHKNHNKLDNRKNNLRTCTSKENSYNQSGNKKRDLPIGIKLSKNGKYIANICVDGKTITLGRYENIEDAIKIRQEAEIKYRGEFAYCLNSSENESILDPLNGLAYDDDSQVCKTTGYKYYGRLPRVEVTIKPFRKLIQSYKFLNKEIIKPIRFEQ